MAFELIIQISVVVTSSVLAGRTVERIQHPIDYRDDHPQQSPFVLHCFYMSARGQYFTSTTVDLAPVINIDWSEQMYKYSVLSCLGGHS